MTFAVNFWWDSPLSLLLKAQPHMHHCFLRQLLAATSSEAVQLLLAGIQPWTDSNITPQQQQQHPRVVEGQGHMPLSPPQQRQEAEERNKPAQQQKQQGVQEGCRQLKRPRLSYNSDPAHHYHQQQQQQGPGLAQQQLEQHQQEQGSPLKHGPGSSLTNLESAALHVLLRGAAEADTHQPPLQQQQQQQQQDHQQQQQQSGLLVGEAWWAQQRASQQQLLAEAAAATATAVEPDSRSHHQQQQQQPGTQHVAAQDKCQQQGSLGLSDPVSRVLVTLQPHQLIRVLWEGAVQNPGRMGDLLLHRLTPAAAQLLTQALEAADGLFADSSSNRSDESAAAAAAATAAGGRRPNLHSEAAAAADGRGSDTAPAADSSQQQQQQQQQGCVGVTRQQFYAALWGTVADPAQALGVLLQHKTHLAAAATDSLLRAQLGRA
jgi:hypothetical protein